MFHLSVHPRECLVYATFLMFPFCEEATGNYKLKTAFSCVITRAAEVTI